MSTEDISLINDVLPIEVLIRIFSFAALPDKRNCRLTCHLWRLLLDHPQNPWRLYFRGNVTNTTVEAFLKSFLNYDGALMENLTTPLPSITLSRNNFPKIINARIGPCNSGENVLTFLQYGCLQATDLLLDRSFGNVGEYQIKRLMCEMTFSCLTRLEISSSLNSMARWENDKAKAKHFKCLMTFFRFAKTPKIEKLVYSLVSGSQRENSLRVNSIGAFYNYISRHTDTLRDIYFSEIAYHTLTESIFVVEGDGLDHIIIPEQSLPMETQIALVDNLKLNTFKIFSSSKPVQSLLLPALGSETLSHLDCAFLGFWSPEAFELLRSIITKNASTLKSLLIMSFGRFDMGILGGSSLVSLDVTVHEVQNDQIQFPTVKNLAMHMPGPHTNFNPYEWAAQSFPNTEKFFWGKSATNYTTDISVPEFQNLWLSLPKLKEYKFLFKRQSEESPDPLREFCEAAPGLIFEDVHQKGEIYLRTIRRRQ